MEDQPIKPIWMPYIQFNQLITGDTCVEIRRAILLVALAGDDKATVLQ